MHKWMEERNGIKETEVDGARVKFLSNEPLEQKVVIGQGLYHCAFEMRFNWPDI